MGDISDFDFKFELNDKPTSVADILDFSRKDFNKAFSLTPKKNITIDTKWELVKLGDIVEEKYFVNGYAFKSNDIKDKNENGDYLPVLKIGNINKSKSIVTFNDDCQFHIAINFESKIIDNGYLAIALTGATVGKSGWVLEKCLINQRVLSIDKRADILKYASIFILSDVFYEYAQSFAHGNAQGNLAPSQVADFKIPLPPKEIQGKIVSECEVIDHEVEQAQQTIEQVKNDIKKEISAVFKSGHEKNKIGSVLSLEYGKSLPERERINGKYPVYGSNGIVGTHNDYLVEAPCVVVGRKGSAGEINWANQDCTPIDTTFYVSLLDNKTDLRYIFHVLKAMDLPSMKGGSGSGGINRNDVYIKMIPVPPLSTQKELVSQIEKLEQKINQAQEIIDKAPEKKQQILDKYLK